MSTEPPYPMAEPTVTYTLREIIDQINKKLDILPSLANELHAQKAVLADAVARIAVAETKIDTIEQLNDQTAGGLMFRDRAWAKLVGLASIMGVVAGVTVSLFRMAGS